MADSNVFVLVLVVVGAILVVTTNSRYRITAAMQSPKPAR